jgi:hypothetical protein
MSDFQTGEEMLSTGFFLDMKYARQNAVLTDAV